MPRKMISWKPSVIGYEEDLNEGAEQEFHSQLREVVASLIEVALPKKPTTYQDLRCDPCAVNRKSCLDLNS